MRVQWYKNFSIHFVCCNAQHTKMIIMISLESASDIKAKQFWWTCHILKLYIVLYDKKAWPEEVYIIFPFVYFSCAFFRQKQVILQVSPAIPLYFQSCVNMILRKRSTQLFLSLFSQLCTWLIWNARGNIPCSSVVMAEWLRRWTRNPMGFSLTGSNPVHDENFFL